MKNNSKIYIVIISILVVIASLLIIKVQIVDKKDSGYIILPGNNVYYLSNGTIQKYNKNISKLNQVNIMTYSGEKEINFTYKNNEITFYKKKEQIELNEQLIIAYSSMLDIDIVNYEAEQLNNQELKEANDILRKNGIIGYDMLTSEKITFDFNQDGSNDTLYFITNLFDESMYDKVFAFAYYIENNEVKYLIKQIDSVENTYDLCIPRVNNIIKLKDEYKLIISCEYFSDIGVDIYFYESNQNLFKLVNN